MKIENEFISGLISGQIDPNFVITSNLEPRYLKIYPDVYEFLLNFYNEYKRMPTMDLVCTRFPVFQPTEIKNPPAEIVRAIRESAKVDLFYKDLRSTIDILQKTGKFEVALNHIANSLEKYGFDEEQDTFDIAGQPELLFELYKRRFEAAKNNLHIGIPSGFGPEFDIWLNGGWQNGNLYGILAPLGTGKSWLSTIAAKSAMGYSKRVLMLMLEGTLEKEGYRLISGFNEISNAAVYSGHADIAQFEAAQRMFKELSEQTGGKIYLGVYGKREHYTRSTVYSKLVKYSPDLLIVDYLNLLSTGQDVEDWQSYATISKSLKNFATSFNIPVIANLQSNRAAHNKEELTAEDSSYYGILRDFDTVIAINKIKGKDNFVSMNDIKGRDQAGNFKAIFQTNFDKAKIKFVDYNDDTTDF